MTKIAFIGLGHMGSPMALNLVKAGHALVVFDLVADAMEPLQQAGAMVADSAAAAVAEAEVVISMLPASQHVENLYIAQPALLDHLEPNTLIVECSTIAPQSAQRVAQAAADKGLLIIDAPVSGGTAGVEAGTLTFIV